MELLSFNTLAPFEKEVDEMVKQKKQLVIAAICALIAMAAVFAYTATVKSEAQIQRNVAVKKYGGSSTQVVVAKCDIKTGQIIEDKNVYIADYPVDLLPQGNAATSIDQVVNKVAAIDIKGNEALLLERVGDGNSRINVPAGLEAVSISSDDVLAVGGAIKAGSFVDVYVETSEGQIVALGQNILVLETSDTSKSEKSNDKVTWVTLAVTQESVSELIAASTKGTVHLAIPGGQSRSSSSQS